MRLFGKEITIGRKKTAQSLSSVDSRNGLWKIIFDSFSGAWQQNIAVNQHEVMAYHAVFACITLIANDIGKLRPKLIQKDDNGIWEETSSPAFSQVLRRPNRYQNHIQFIENWIISKLSRGNTYGLKERDNRGVVRAVYILDPDRVTPLVAPDGSVFYQLGDDNLAGIESMVIAPASEIIHDRMNCLFHPLVGLSPIYACGLSATQGLAMQKNSTRLFTNMSRPSGVLTAPGAISNEVASRLKEKWDENFTGENFGKTAVLGDGLKYERISFTAEEAQLIEQMKWSSEVVCSTFHVPPFKTGIGQMPTYQNAEVLNQIYYSDCLQSLIEQFETCMDEGLGLDKPIDGRWMGVELDLDGLLRMDTATQIKTLTEGVKGAVLTPNEARKRIDKKPLAGGDTVYMQQQNFSLAALDARDRNDPFTKPDPAPQPTLPAPESEDEDLTELALTELYSKSPETMHAA